jgi:hypothetical protein
MEQNIIPIEANLSLNVVATETLSNTASIAIPLKRSCSAREIPNFSNVFNNSGSTSSKDFGDTLVFGAA